MAYSVKVAWKKQAEDSFVDNKYSRAHVWTFDCGIEVPASSSPHVVPLPMSVENAVDPEEAFIASLASCHMLWFLSIAAGKGYAIVSYEDNAGGVLAKNAAGRLAMTRITLRPHVEFAGQPVPSPQELDTLHELAHKRCFIASSVTSEIAIEPVYPITPK